MRIESLRFREVDSRTVLLGLAMTCSIMGGCGQPIYDSVVLDEEVVSVTPIEGDPFEDWPMTAAGYVSVKPPPLSFPYRIEKPLRCPAETKLEEAFNTEIVAWDRSKFDDSMNKWIDSQVLIPKDDVHEVLKLQSEEILGRHAFDLSSKGDRLVFIKDRTLVLHRIDGSKIGERPLPGFFTESDPVVAVRFCENSTDLILVSAKQIARMSGTSGQVTAVFARPNNASESLPDSGIAALEGNVGADHFVLVQNDGEVFFGDSELADFRSMGKQDVEDCVAASVSPDGKSFIVSTRSKVLRFDVSSGLPNISLVQDDPEYERFTSIAAGDQYAFVAYGGHFQKFSFDDPNNGVFDQGVWKIDVYSPKIFERNRYGTVLMAGRRVRNGQVEPILFSRSWASSTGFGHPQIIDHEVARLLTSFDRNSCVTLSKEGDLRILNIAGFVDHWQQFRYWELCRFVDNNRLDELVSATRILAKQKRFVGNSPEDMRCRAIRDIGSRWDYLNRTKPESPVLENLSAWLAEGSPEALTAKACERIDAAWRKRGTSYVNQIAPQDYADYQRLIGEAMPLLERAIQSEHCCATAYRRLIAVKLETGSNLEDIDSLCQEALERFPGSMEIHYQLMVKLLPQWFGEGSDSLAYASAISELYEDGYGDYLYLRLAANLMEFYQPRTSGVWKGIDIRKLERGFEFFEDLPGDVKDREAPWRYVLLCDRVFRDRARSTAAIEHLMQRCFPISPGYFRSMVRSNYDQVMAPIMTRIDEIWKEAESVETPRG
ncbi:MAG: hypothetical protein AAF664_00680 [Planctomycetota bacterium]